MFLVSSHYTGGASADVKARCVGVGNCISQVGQCGMGCWGQYAVIAINALQA